MPINLDTPTILICTIGETNSNLKSIYLAAKMLNVPKLLLIYDEDMAEHIKEDLDKIQKHFQILDTQVFVETTEIANHETEYLLLAKTIANIIEDEEQIVIDTNIGSRYIRPLIHEAVENICRIHGSLFKHRIDFYEALRKKSSSKIYFVKAKHVGISLNEYKVLQLLEMELTEREIGEEIGVKQSTISTHIQNMKRKGLIEGGSKRKRKKTVLGDLFQEIVDLMINKFGLENVNKIDSLK